MLSLRPQLRKTGHRITVECPKNLEIDGYPGALSQLLTNFLLNSLMHAYDRGRPATSRSRAAHRETD